MKKGILALACVTLLATQSQAQGWLNVLKNAVGESNSSSNSNGNAVGNLSSSDIAAGLRQALEIGAQNASKRLHATNGFFGDALIKVMMPPEAQNAANTLRALGMGSVVDKAILSMNRAAEDAAGKAAPIFVDAIKKMSIQDAVGILRGGNGAATAYLKQATTAALTTAFRPVIQSSLGKVGATAYWTDLTRIYNQLPTTRRRINEDLSAYVTERALNGLFLNIANEENKIRQDPAARVTELLNKVFGAR